MVMKRKSIIILSKCKYAISIYIYHALLNSTIKDHVSKHYSCKTYYSQNLITILVRPQKIGNDIYSINSLSYLSNT